VPAEDAGLAEVPFNVVFTGVPHPAVGVYRLVGCLEPGVGAQVLGHVRLPAAGQTLVVAPGSVAGHQLCRVEPDHCFGERKGDALVLTDGPAENDALVGVPDRPADGRRPDAECVVGEQDPLRVQAIQEVLEPVALLADPRGSGNERSSNTTL
jgi:hypothetical protein